MAGFMNLSFCIAGRLIVCTLIFIDVVQVVSGEGCRNCSEASREHKLFKKGKWYQPREFALTGGAYRNQSSSAVTRCASSCLQIDNCTSFKYCEDDKLCQLNSLQPENDTALQTPSHCVNFEDKLLNAWKNPPHKVAGALKHVSVGEAGIWGVDVRSNLYYKALCGSSWTHHKDASNLGLVQVDVGKNVIWAINKFNYVYLSEISTSRPDTLVFSKASDWAQHISVSQKGHVWGCISLNVIHRTGVTIDKPGGDAWRYVGHGYAQISVGSGGVWGVTHTKKISYRVGTYGDPDSDTDGSDWENVESLGISPQYVSSGDVIYITDTKGVIYYRVGTSAETPTGTAWQKIGGNLKQVEALSGTFWGVDAENNVYTNEA